MALSWAGSLDRGHLPDPCALLCTGRRGQCPGSPEHPVSGLVLKESSPPSTEWVLGMAECDDVSEGRWGESCDMMM